MWLAVGIDWHPNILSQLVLTIVRRWSDTSLTLVTHRTWGLTQNMLLWQEIQRVRIASKRHFPWIWKLALSRSMLGGNLAAVLSMRLTTNRATRHLPRLQVLIYPLLQCFDFMLPSYQEDYYEVYPYSIEYALSVYTGETIDKSIYRNNHTSVEQKRYYRRFVDWKQIPDSFRSTHRGPTTDNYNGDPILIQRAAKLLHPEISPLLAEDSQLAKLPPTYVLTVGHDRLRDEGFIYVARLKRCGVQVVHHHYKEGFHASIASLYGRTKLDIAHQMVGNIIDYLRRNLWSHTETVLIMLSILPKRSFLRMRFWRRSLSWWLKYIYSK